MKILIVATISDTVHSFLIPHIRYLVKLGHKVDVAYSIEEDVDPELYKIGCSIHAISFRRFPFDRKNLSAYQEIREIVLKEKYDLIHTHTPIASFLTRLACRRIPNIKILYTAHGFHFSKGGPLSGWFLYYPLEKLAARWTDGIVTMNQEDYHIAHKFNLRENGKIFYVHGVGINTEIFIPQTSKSKALIRKENHYKEDDFILIYVGELSTRKGQNLLIDVIYQLRQRIPSIKLLLAGDGPMEGQYKERVKALDLEGHVKFLGYRKDISTLMLMSDVAVSSSKREGLPVNVMEAMATGLPLVVTDCRGNRDLVRNNENGFVINRKDSDQFANGVDKLYKSQKLRRKFGGNSRKQLDKYLLNNVVEEMESVYREFLLTEVQVKNSIQLS